MPNTPATWEPGSIVTLYKVPWDSAYTDVIDWQRSDGSGSIDRDVYFASIAGSDSIEFLKSAYMPIGIPVQIDIPYETAYAFNYLVVTNPATPKDGSSEQTFYYFITDMTRPNPSSTLCSLQLDVWTTYAPDMEFGIGYVERGHVGMANAPSLDDENIPQALNRYLSTSEGIETGDRFYAFKEEGFSLQESDGEFSSDFIAIVSTADLTASPGTVNSPNLKTASGDVVDGLYSGANVYFVKTYEISNLLTALSKSPWIAQCIVSISVVPASFVPTDKLKVTEFPYYPYSLIMYTAKDGSPFTWNDDSPFLDVPGQIDISYVSDSGWDGIERYSSLRKLWTYPYSVVELCASASGQSVFLKPQAFGKNILALKALTCAIQPFASAAVFPEFYGSMNPESFSVACYNAGNTELHTEAMIRQVPYGDFLDCALWFSEFPQFSIVNNSYIAYMASTANTRAYQYSSAEWAQKSANMSASNSFAASQMNLALANANATADINTQIANNDINNYNQAAQIVNSASQGVVSSIGSAAKINDGLAVGAITGLGNTALQTVQSYRDLDATMQVQNNNIALQQLKLANSQAVGYDVADLNYTTSLAIAQGNYDNQIASIDAGYADAALKQPSSSGNVGGNGFRYTNGLLCMYTVKYERVSKDAIARVGDYMFRFGYAINRFVNVPTTLVFNRYFSYWKMHQLFITKASCIETFKDTVRGIFEKGVTIWRNPSEIGTVLPYQNDVTVTDTYYI